MIIINTIQECSCCAEAEMILKIYNMPFTKKNVKTSEKKNYKKKYNMETFPQITNEDFKDDMRLPKKKFGYNTRWYWSGNESKTPPAVAAARAAARALVSRSRAAHATAPCRRAAPVPRRTGNLAAAAPFGTRRRGRLTRLVPLASVHSRTG